MKHGKFQVKSRAAVGGASSIMIVEQDMRISCFSKLIPLSITTYHMCGLLKISWDMKRSLVVKQWGIR